MREKINRLTILSEDLERLVNRLDELYVMSTNLRNSGHDLSASIEFGYGEKRSISAEIDKSLTIKIVDEQILKIKDRIITVTEDLERTAKL